METGNSVIQRGKNLQLSSLISSSIIVRKSAIVVHTGGEGGEGGEGGGGEVPADVKAVMEEEIKLKTEEYENVSGKPDLIWKVVLNNDFNHTFVNAGNRK